MKLIITDSNVFFDIIKIQALLEFFALNFEICTTDFVKNEILESEQHEQIEIFIRLQKLTMFELNRVEVLHRQRRLQKKMMLCWAEN